MVAFLYNEVNEADARAFELHLKNCSDCKADLVALRQIRQSVGAWRDECLGVSSSSVVESDVVQVSNGVTL
ncbi:anti-sigma factor family protein, partial [Salmonella sp. SAL4355]|uniref:anti-sigma factor family protein n=1 Tax=Salmonella sp. SAL4355 TaxID=3159876 RepID=UPI00397C8165